MTKKNLNVGNELPATWGENEDGVLATFKLPKISTQEENNSYQSAGTLMRRLADAVRDWRAELPDTVQPVIIAILQGGVQVSVTALAQESFHGIRIEGLFDGRACVVLAHQNTVQLLCTTERVEKEEQRRTIGFIIDGVEEKV